MQADDIKALSDVRLGHALECLDTAQKVMELGDYTSRRVYLTRKCLIPCPQMTSLPKNLFLTGRTRQLSCLVFSCASLHDIGFNCELGYLPNPPLLETSKGAGAQKLIHFIPSYPQHLTSLINTDHIFVVVEHMMFLLAVYYLSVDFSLIVYAAFRFICQPI